jgi:RnfABCDGE-type electron transport complex G subunit
MIGFDPSRGGGALLRGVLVLTLICLVSGLGVGLLYASMKDDIEANERQVFLDTLADVLGEADSYRTVGEYDVSVADLDKVYVNQMDGDVLYAATGAAQGYQSTVTVLVAVRAERAGAAVGEDPVIHRMAVVSSQETPGLGENIRHVEKDRSIWRALLGGRESPRRPWFQEQFAGKRLSDLVVEKRQDTGRIAAVTGATITSRATTEAARRAVHKIIQTTGEAYGE